MKKVKNREERDAKRAKMREQLPKRDRVTGPLPENSQDLDTSSSHEISAELGGDTTLEDLMGKAAGGYFSSPSDRDPYDTKVPVEKLPDKPQTAKYRPPPESLNKGQRRGHTYARAQQNRGFFSKILGQGGGYKKRKTNRTKRTKRKNTKKRTKRTKRKNTKKRTKRTKRTKK